MNTVISNLVMKATPMFVGCLLGMLGFLIARYMNQGDTAAQYTMVQIASIQKDIKQIEVSIASINARLLTTDQVRLIATEVADAKIHKALLEHVRQAHESAK